MRYHCWQDGGSIKLVATSITFLLTIQIQGVVNVFGAKTKQSTNNAIETALPGTLVPLTVKHKNNKEHLTLLTSENATTVKTYDGNDDDDDDDAGTNNAIDPNCHHYLHQVYGELEQHDMNIQHKAQRGQKPQAQLRQENSVDNTSMGNSVFEVNSKAKLHVVSVLNRAFNHTSPRARRSVFHVRWNPNEKFVVESREKPAVNHSKLSPHPRWALSKNTKLTLNPKVYVCHDKYSDRCGNKTASFRQYVVQTFENSLSESANETNFYNVDFKPLFGDSFEEQYYPSACLVMEAGVRVLKRRDAPFNRLEFGKLFPKQKLFRHLKSIKTCAIISSAGSMAGSKLGRFIDSHDIVMRFNNAPTQGYEVDVGSKTTIRVVNSQVVTKAEFEFTHAPIFQNVTIAAWDPGKYNGTLGDWLTSADYDLFTNYEIYRRRYPKSRAFLIHPHSIWRLWQSLQMFAGNRPIRKNPPSSGFIGLALLLPHCPYVDFIEYMPSTRLNGRCHYYSKEMNSACTFGAWHPLAAEKLMALDMNIADDMSVFQFGLLRIRRPNKLLCGFNFLGY